MYFKFSVNTKYGIDVKYGLKLKTFSSEIDFEMFNSIDNHINNMDVKTLFIGKKNYLCINLSLTVTKILSVLIVVILLLLLIVMVLL